MLETYIAELKKITLLSSEEEQVLWKKYKDHGALEARCSLIEQYQPLVFREALGYRSTKLELMDLIQEGMIGLIEAVENFDYAKQVAFSLFAVHRIRGRMIDFLRKEGKSASLTIKSLEDNPLNWENIPDEEVSTEVCVEEKVFWELVTSGLKRLPEKEQLVLEEFYLEDKPIKFIAADLGNSQSYINRLQRQGIKRLRGFLSRVRHEWKK